MHGKTGDRLWPRISAVEKQGMSNATAPTAVPAYRLGQLLIEARQSQGFDLETFAQRSSYTVGELADIEAGHRLLNETLIDDITNLYEVDCGPIIPERARLTIDLDQGTLSASGRAVQLESNSYEHVLDRYLSLVYVMRGEEPGTQVSLRKRDLAILAASLAEREELILEQLERSMDRDSESVRGLVAWFKSRLWVPRAGLLVGSVSLGTLVMIAGEPVAADDTAQPLPEPEPEPESTRSGLILPSGVNATPAETEPSTATYSAPGEARAVESLTTEPRAVETPAIEATTAETPDTEPSDIETADIESSDIETSDIETSDIEQATTAVDAVDAVEALQVEAPQVETAQPTSPAAIGRQAESLLPFDFRQVLPGWDVTYSGGSELHRGLTYTKQQTIEIFVSPSDTPQMVAGILAHEIGHAIDVTHLQHEHRLAWQQERGVGDSPWWPGAYATDFHTGAGDFAEVFAYWTIGDPSSSTVGNPIDNADLALLDAWFPWLRAN